MSQLRGIFCRGAFVWHGCRTFVVSRHRQTEGEKLIRRLPAIVLRHSFKSPLFYGYGIALEWPSFELEDLNGYLSRILSHPKREL